MSELKMPGKLPKTFTKTELEELAMQDIQTVIDNDKYDLLKVLIELKRYEVYLNKLTEALKKPALEKATGMGERNFIYADAKVSVTKRVIYDYSSDKIWSAMNDDLTSIKKQIKKHQEILKALESETTEIVDEQSGQVISLTPPIKKEEESLTIRL